MLPRPIELFVEDLRNNRPDYLGIALFGSWARGDNRPSSDIDLFILTDGLDRRAVEKIGNINIEIVYTTEDGARTFALKRMDSFLNMWRDAQVIFDRNGGLERLKVFATEKEQEGKPQLQQWQEKHTEFDIQDALRAVAEIMKEDSATAEMYLQRTTYNLLQFYFDKNRIWTPAPKKQLKWLRENDVALADKFDAFYTATSIDNSLKLAEELSSYILSSDT